jgi:putative solute:sodium symporter small subunit
MAEEQNFEVNFFKPRSEATKANTKLISLLVIIWAVAVFGFQFLLIGFQKPVEEQTLTEFKTLWPKIQSAPTEADLRSFAKVMLYTMGKNATIKEGDRELMRKALAVTVNLLKPDEQTSDAAAEKIGLGNSGFDPLLKDQLDFHYESSSQGDYSGLSELPEAMAKYLVHNRSFLTDTSFIGFPLHYFYTAQFLLILFIVLCLVYARAIDKMNTRLGIEE